MAFTQKRKGMKTLKPRAAAPVKDPIKKMLAEPDPEEFEGPGYGAPEDESDAAPIEAEADIEEDEDHEEAEVEEDHQEIRVRIKKKGRSERLELMDMRREFKDRIWVRFQTTNEPDGEYPIKAAINGHTFVIKREQDVFLPRCVLKMLDDAIYTKYREDKERSKGGELVYKAVTMRRFPYSIVDRPAIPAKAA